MAYRDDILALDPDHYWTFDNAYTDLGEGPSAPKNANSAGGAPTFDATPIAEDSTHSLLINTDAERVEAPDSAQMNSQAREQRTLCGWFQASQIFRPPTAIYKEGSNNNNMAILIGFGNKIIAQASDQGDFDIQVYSDDTLTPDRSYHICFKFDGSNGDDEFSLFIDGIKQSVSVPADAAPGKTTMAAHSGDIGWGNPDANIGMGGIFVGFSGPTNGYYSHWASWSTVLTDTEIREELFEKGATPVHVVTNQTQLDALADTLISETPKAIQVDVAGSISLSADNITFSEASIHVEYTGTGTLTWTNDNGSNATIAATTGGGTVVFENPAILTLTGLENATEVRVFEGGTTTEIGGSENVTTGSFALSVSTATVDVSILSLGFQNIRLDGLDMSSGDLTVPVQQNTDRQYNNP